LMPALGVAARFYDTLAESLRQQGLAVLVMEQRGHGDSAVRASRRQDHGFREALSEDIPALLDWLHTRTPGCRTLLMG
ncbi:alpha/beta hydrolase, partial [Acinetobacter baumannii]